jgi:hypothetical protein
MKLSEFALYRHLRQRALESDLPRLAELANRAEMGDERAAAELRKLMLATLKGGTKAHLNGHGHIL